MSQSTNWRTAIPAPMPYTPQWLYKKRENIVRIRSVGCGVRGFRWTTKLLKNILWLPGNVMADESRCRGKRKLKILHEQRYCTRFGPQRQRLELPHHYVIYFKITKSWKAGYFGGWEGCTMMDLTAIWRDHYFEKSVNWVHCYIPESRALLRARPTLHECALYKFWKNGIYWVHFFSPSYKTDLQVGVLLSRIGSFDFPFGRMWFCLQDGLDFMIDIGSMATSNRQGVVPVVELRNLPLISVSLATYYGS